MPSGFPPGLGSFLYFKVITDTVINRHNSPTSLLTKCSYTGQRSAQLNTPFVCLLCIRVTSADRREEEEGSRHFLGKLSPPHELTLAPPSLLLPALTSDVLPGVGAATCGHEEREKNADTLLNCRTNLSNHLCLDLLKREKNKCLFYKSLKFSFRRLAAECIPKGHRKGYRVLWVGGSYSFLVTSVPFVLNCHIT